MELVLASKNPKKLIELNAILSQLGIRVCSEADVGVDVDVEETGTTFEENSLLKADAVMKASGMPAIADDSGLCVDALQGAPGVYSARYAGEACDTAANNALLLKNLQGISDRRGAFHCAICVCFPDGSELTAEGRCDGVITESPRGENGFGYDPLFYVESYGKTFAELSADEKNAISHRSCALRELKQKLEEYSYAHK